MERSTDSIIELIFLPLLSKVSSNFLYGSSGSFNTPLIVTISDSKCVVRNPFPNLPVVLDAISLFFSLSFVETCSIKNVIFSDVNGFPLWLNSNIFLFVSKFILVTIFLSS